MSHLANVQSDVFSNGSIAVFEFAACQCFNYGMPNTMLSGMARTHMGEHSEGAWLDAVTLFQSVRDADHDAAARLLRTSSDPEAVVLNLLGMLGVYLRGEAPDNLDHFIAASHRAGPPPSPRPPLPPLT